MYDLFKGQSWSPSNAYSSYILSTLVKSTHEQMGKWNNANFRQDLAVWHGYNIDWNPCLRMEVGAQLLEFEIEASALMWKIVDLWKLISSVPFCLPMDKMVHIQWHWTWIYPWRKNNNRFDLKVLNLVTLLTFLHATNLQSSCTKNQNPCIMMQRNHHEDKYINTLYISIN